MPRPHGVKNKPHKVQPSKDYVTKILRFLLPFHNSWGRCPGRSCLIPNDLCLATQSKEMEFDREYGPGVYLVLQLSSDFWRAPVSLCFWPYPNVRWSEHGSFNSHWFSPRSPIEQKPKRKGDNTNLFDCSDGHDAGRRRFNVEIYVQY